MTSYTRREIGGGQVEFTIRPGSATGGGPAGVNLRALGLAAVAAVVIIATGIPLGILLGVVAGYFVYRFVARRSGSASGGGDYVFVVSPAGVRWPHGMFTDRSSISELLWRDWSSGDGGGNHSVYIEMSGGQSHIVQTDFDGATAQRLAGEMAAALGNVPVTGGAPERVKTLAVPAAGDLVLTQLGVGSYELQEETGHGRATVMPVPLSDEVAAMMFAIETAGSRAVWLVKLDSPVAMELPNPNRQSAV